MGRSDRACTSYTDRSSASPWRAIIAGVCCAFMMTTLSFAQGSRGTIRGTVTDPNGAAVAGATARLIDARRGAEIRTVQTNNDGVYQFVEIEPNAYDVIITAPGF